jgi:hypothetical protein
MMKMTLSWFGVSMVMGGGAKAYELTFGQWLVVLSVELAADAMVMVIMW